MRKLNLPLNQEELLSLKAGEEVLLNGVIYTARDAAHKLLVESIENGEELPFDLANSAIYYVGPTPTKKGSVIGSCGPTSSYRMDSYGDILMDKGVKIMIGKGERSSKFQESLVKHQAVYLSALGGLGALINESIVKCELVAYEELGTEAIYKLTVKDFYAIVYYDTKGNIFK